MMFISSVYEQMLRNIVFLSKWFLAYFTAMQFISSVNEEVRL